MIFATNKEDCQENKSFDHQYKPNAHNYHFPLMVTLPAPTSDGLIESNYKDHKERTKRKSNVAAAPLKIGSKAPL